MRDIAIPAVEQVQILEAADVEAAVAPVRDELAGLSAHVDDIGATLADVHSALEVSINGVSALLTARINAIPPPPVIPTIPPVGSGIPMPTGYRPHWTQVLADDFLTDCPEGGFLAAYGARWDTYRPPGQVTDTSGRGRYSPNFVSVAGSIATARLFTDTQGQAQSFALRPLMPGASPNPQGATTTLSSVGMRVSACVRIRLDDGWKVAHMFWGVDGKGAEIDFPEFEGTHNIGGFVHPKAGSQVQATSDADPTEWHVVTTEWVAGTSARLLVDGREIFTAPATAVPSAATPMRWIGQCETSLRKDTTGAYLPIPPTAQGVVEWDWITIHTPA